MVHLQVEHVHLHSSMLLHELETLGSQQVYLSSHFGWITFHFVRFLMRLLKDHEIKLMVIVKECKKKKLLQMCWKKNSPKIFTLIGHKSYFFACALSSRCTVCSFLCWQFFTCFNGFLFHLHVLLLLLFSYHHVPLSCVPFYMTHPDW